MQPTQVSAPARIGAPDGDGDQDTSANLSAPLVPNTRASFSWPAASTFAQKWPALAIRGQVADARLGQNSTSGGSSDRAANDWQAKPAGPSSSRVVMTVTPVQKWPSTCRNRPCSSGTEPPCSTSIWQGKTVAPQADSGGLPGHPGSVVNPPAAGAVLDVEPARRPHVERHHQVVGVPPEGGADRGLAPGAPVHRAADIVERGDLDHEVHDPGRGGERGQRERVMPGVAAEEAHPQRWPRRTAEKLGSHPDRVAQPETEHPGVEAERGLLVGHRQHDVAEPLVTGDELVPVRA